MKRMIFLLLIGIFLIGISKADNGFCFIPNMTGTITDNWSNSLINSTLIISSEFGKTPNGYPPYCMTNVSNIKLNTDNFNINNIIVASTGRNCSLRYELTKFGYLKLTGYIIIKSNQKNYTYNFKIEPNTEIKLLEYGTNKSLDGIMYINGKEYCSKNGLIKVPITNDIIYLFYKGDNEHDQSSNVTTINNFLEKNNLIYYIYKKPKVDISLYQDKNETNKGEKWNIYVKIKNDIKFSSPVIINYTIDGCGINRFNSIKTSKIFQDSLNYNKSCKIDLDYLIFDTINKQITKNTISLYHNVSNEYKISYSIKGNYIYAKVLDINNNPVKTNISIIYNGKRINMKLNGTKYYAKIPGNNFTIEAKKDGNKGIIGITGNFIKKKHGIDYGVITLEAILSTITGVWIYKSRKLKK